ncbi:hypothetical protein SAMN05216226_105195 [Halovenus aranensis]|uniref:Uncharacterized protein n=1 Tax=Halovenus aranensis TaxID=890420 RepID=A0A1G8V0S5_9EURY|nr:hypothetical protein [Halovenus aranensis]SDJ58780.1 hypothetical protein SAMN05216226_105195 [Halovenus aranensis]
MFTERTLSETLELVKERHAPDALVLDSAENFESLPPAQAEDLLLVTDSVTPVTHPDDRVPPNSPEVLTRYASSDLVVGMPGDGSVVWTHQTDPPVVVCKPRLEESPDAFADFLVAEALVEVGLGEPEHFLGLFGSDYPRFAAACDDLLSPAETYQVAAACYDAYLGLQTRETFAEWEGPLFEAWADAGERLEPRVDGLPGEMARGGTSFAEAAELACSAVKHAGELPPPFEALNTSVYLDHGPEYAVEWVERTVDALLEE